MEIIVDSIEERCISCPFQRDAKFCEYSIAKRLKGHSNNICALQVPQTATCDDAITLFLEKKISSVPVVDSYGRVLGVIGKSDIMSELVRHPNNYLEILDIPIMVS
ncbi:hypothetical protein Y032_0001g173 [Ancylostoma ceylanicum]|uniref:CBS domain-containing protein n=1 Tax=Ancylostoma ceylanicum TaxID=53326 RepID=A0A016W4K1_9BILA|nr:hypothetical protein Y032_0001g173 [Ancylostoma ceylanicum]